MKTLALVGCLVMAVGAFGQSAKVVPVDSATTARLVRLKADMDAADKAFADAVEAAKKETLTTRDNKRGACTAFREGENKSSQFFTISGISSGVMTLGGYAPECETAEEKAAAKKREKQADLDRVKYDEEHPWRYWGTGFCNGSQFTDDFRYLVPSPPEAKIQNNWGGQFPTIPQAIAN